MEGLLKQKGCLPTERETMDALGVCFKTAKCINVLLSSIVRIMWRGVTMYWFPATGQYAIRMNKKMLVVDQAYVAYIDDLYGIEWSLKDNEVEIGKLEDVVS